MSRQRHKKVTQALAHFYLRYVYSMYVMRIYNMHDKIDMYDIVPFYQVKVTVYRKSLKFCYNVHLAKAILTFNPSAPWEAVNDHPIEQ